MSTKDRIKDLQSKGLSIKGISLLSNVSVDTLYNITSDRLKNIPNDVSNRLNEALNKAESIFDYD